jgi:hypothetical protein
MRAFSTIEIGNMMRALLLCAFLVVVFAGCRLPFSEAKKRYTFQNGSTAARQDIEAGTLRIRYGGMPWPTYWKEEEIWMKAFGVHLSTTCEAFSGPYLEGYNSIAIPVIQQRYGSNVLDEVRERARVEYEKEQKRK